MREAPQPVDSLVLSKQVRIEEVCTDDVSVVLRAPAQLSLHRPLIANGKAYPIVHACHDQVWLEDVAGLSVGDSMRQERVVSTDVGILEEFTSVWKARWSRIEHLAPSQWEQICAFSRQKLSPIPWTFPTWSLDLVRQTLRSKKKRSATGPDGVSRADLLALPDSALLPVLGLYNHLESHGTWPLQLTQGYVNCLDKGKGDGGVDSYRPIVIYPMLARLWSTVRARQALASLGPHLPGGLHGGIPTKQAKSIWYSLAQLVESSHFAESSLLGIAVDIQRAFNNLPREPIWCAVIQLGLPEAILRPYIAFLPIQARRFRIRGAVGPPVLSTTGYPEGCAWSVFSMAVCDLLLTLWLDSLITSPHQALTYIDDWHVIFVDPALFDSVWHALTSFSASMQLPLDVCKSYCWATGVEDRKSLRQRPIGSVLAARDLGAHQNFSLRSGNRTLLDRIASLGDLWPKLRKSVSPYETKLFVLTQMAWPRAMHGISVVHLGAHRFTCLRAGAMQGIRANRIGANPFLRFMQHGVLCDPEGWAIVQTVRELREVGSIDQMEKMLDFAYAGVELPPNGPCAILVHRLQRLGWTLCPGGVFRDLLGDVPALRMSWNAFVARVQFSWPRVVAAAVSHRKTLAGIQFADVAEARKVLAGMGPADRKFLQCCMDGTMYQDLKKTKEQRGASSLCTFCGSQDSPFHRVWECSHFASCRSRCQVLSLIPHLAPSLTCHGWPVIPAAWFDLCWWFLAVPPVDVSVLWPVFPPDHTFHLFVDGACHCPSEPKLRYASWGVSLASSGFGSLDHRILSCGHVMGLEQTAFRGELEAMVWALRAVAAGQVRAVIWSDCDSVVRKTRKVLGGSVIPWNKPHSDLWRVISDLVSTDRLSEVVIQKVASHCDISSAANDVEAWAFWHNALVDTAASSFNNRRPDTFWRMWDSVRQSLTYHRFLHREIVDVLLQVGRFAKHVEAAEATVQQVDSVPSSRTVSDWVVPHKLVKLYRAENLDQLHKWWCNFGVPALSSRGPMRWVSGMQLWADFALETGWRGPISPRFGRWFLGNGDQPENVVCSIDLRAKSFLRMWKAYLKANDMVIQSKVQRPHSHALGFWALCFHIAWPESRLRVIDDAFFELGGRQICRPQVLAGFSWLSFPEGTSWA